MAIELDMGSADFERRFEALLHAKREFAADVDAAVGAIIDEVRARGDEALAEFSLRFDRVDLARQGTSRSTPPQSTPRSRPASPSAPGARTRPRAREGLS